MSQSPPLNWRHRDDAMLSLALRHVVCPRHFFQFFPSKQTAYRRIKRLEEMKLLRKVGETMVQDTGRQEKVYCNGWKPKSDQLRHEVLLTDFLLLYGDAETVRGWHVDRTLRPDAEMRLHGLLYYVELDTGHMSLSQIRKRQEAYRGASNLVLYVTLGTQVRLRNLMRTSERIEQIGLFTTFSQAMNDPCGRIWQNRQGEQLSIANVS